jgi:hypothetical protein
MWRTREAEGAPVRVGVEIHEPEEQVLVEVAAHQPLLGRVAVEERFPRLHLPRSVLGQRRRTLVGRARREPARDRLELALVEPGQAVRHSRQRELARVGLVLLDARAVLLPVERKIEWLGQHFVAGQRMGALSARLR